MRGAIFGDIVGSPYEFKWNHRRTKTFPLCIRRSRFTDDTVMTIAVAEGLSRAYGEEQTTEKAVIAAMQRYGAKYPDAGYGARFSGWLTAEDPQPYHSFGNGSAMRVSSVAWLYDDLSDVERYAAITAKVTHDHPEGIKGAQATAAAVFLARQGESKEQIKEYIEQKYQYDLHRTCAAIRQGYRRVVSCQKTVPEAVTAFLEGESFEDVIRTAVSLGGDSDTLAAIAGSIAEAYYGIPDNLWQQVEPLLDDTIRAALQNYDRFLEKKEKQQFGGKEK